MNDSEKNAELKDMLENYLKKRRWFSHDDRPDEGFRMNRTEYLDVHGYRFPAEVYSCFSGSRLCLCFDIYLGIVQSGNEMAVLKAAVYHRTSETVQGIRAVIRPECTFHQSSVNMLYMFEIGDKEMSDGIFDDIFRLVSDSLYATYYPAMMNVATEGYREDDLVLLKKKQADVICIARYIEMQKLKGLIEFCRLYSFLSSDDELEDKLDLLADDMAMQQRICLFLGETLSALNLERFFDLSDDDERMFRTIGLVVYNCLAVKDGMLVFEDNDEIRRLLEEDVWIGDKPDESEA